MRLARQRLCLPPEGARATGQHIFPLVTGNSILRSRELVRFSHVVKHAVTRTVVGFFVFVLTKCLYLPDTTLTHLLFGDGREGSGKRRMLRQQSACQTGTGPELGSLEPR